MININYRSDIEIEKILSNLYPYKIIVDDVECASIEGFLQSLKCNNPQKASVLRGMYGGKCFLEGQKFNSWKDRQTLFWKGVEIHRTSLIYQRLLNRAYDALVDQNEMFREALISTQDQELEHTMGKTDVTDSVLTRAEYLYNLYRVRSRLMYDKFNTCSRQ